MQIRYFIWMSCQFIKNMLISIFKSPISYLTLRMIRICKLKLIRVSFIIIPGIKLSLQSEKHFKTCLTNFSSCLMKMKKNQKMKISKTKKNKVIINKFTLYFQNYTKKNQIKIKSNLRIKGKRKRSLEIIFNLFVISMLMILIFYIYYCQEFIAEVLFILYYQDWKILISMIYQMKEIIRMNFHLQMKFDPINFVIHFIQQ